MSSNSIQYLSDFSEDNKWELLELMYNFARKTKPDAQCQWNWSGDFFDKNEAKRCMNSVGYIDYLSGRCMKINVFQDENQVDGRLYDREYGNGSFSHLVETVKQTIGVKPPGCFFCSKQLSHNNNSDKTFFSKGVMCKKCDYGGELHKYNTNKEALKLKKIKESKCNFCFKEFKMYEERRSFGENIMCWRCYTNGKYV